MCVMTCLVDDGEGVDAGPREEAEGNVHHLCVREREGEREGERGGRERDNTRQNKSRPTSTAEER